VDIKRFYSLLVEKKKFEFAPPICFVPDSDVPDQKKAKRVYNWMRISCYQYSVLNMFLSILMITILFFDDSETI